MVVRCPPRWLLVEPNEKMRTRRHSLDSRVPVRGRVVTFPVDTERCPQGHLSTSLYHSAFFLSLCSRYLGCEIGGIRVTITSVPPIFAPPPSFHGYIVDYCLTKCLPIVDLEKPETHRVQLSLVFRSLRPCFKATESILRTLGIVRLCPPPPPLLPSGMQDHSG